MRLELGSDVRRQKRLRGTTSTRKEIRKEIRTEEKAKAKENSERTRDEDLIAKVARKQLLATAANAKKREWRERAERAEHLAAQRLEKLKSFKEVDECDDEMVIDASTAQMHADAYAKLQSMPKWQRTSRGKGGGKGGKKLEDEHRVTIYSMFANQTPLSAISSNIIAVVKQTAPWLKPAPISNRTLTDCRFELGLDAVLIEGEAELPSVLAQKRGDGGDGGNVARRRRAAAVALGTLRPAVLWLVWPTERVEVGIDGGGSDGARDVPRLGHLRDRLDDAGAAVDQDALHDGRLKRGENHAL